VAKKLVKKVVSPIKKSPKKETKKEKKEPKVSLKNLVVSQCQKNENLILMDVTDESAFIVKKKFETVRRELCPGTMNPIEMFEDMIFFHCFIVRWKHKKNPKKSAMETLAERGFPIYDVEIEYDVFKAIDDA
jgi:hypothetical protein